MTAQIEDTIRYKGEDWTLVASTSGFRFDPHEYGLRPLGLCTACWDGYYEEFSIVRKKLKLRRLWICLENYPSLLGVEAKERSDDFIFDHCYDLNLKIDFTGKMMLGKGFLYDYYAHMGYQQPWSYLELYELEFRDGVLIDVTDLSHCASAMRTDLRKDSDLLKEVHPDISSFVDNSFARDYENKAWWIGRYEELKKKVDTHSDRKQ